MPTWNRRPNQLIEDNDLATLRMTQSLVQVEPVVYDKLYDCRIIKVIEDDCFKLSMPIEYGQSVPLPLDRIYEIRIRTEQGDYLSSGRITERYRDEDGDVMIFYITEALSKIMSKKFLMVDTSIQAKYSLQDSKETNSGMITAMAIDSLKMRGMEFIEDHSKLDIVFSLAPGKDIVVGGEVVETLRTRDGDFESAVRIGDMDIHQQEYLAKWILEQPQKRGNAVETANNL